MAVEEFVDATFRACFPEFASETVYPPAVVAFWSGIGDSRLNVKRWGDLRLQGLYLFTAHHIVLATINKLDSEVPGNVPGQGSQIMGSQSADGVSVSLDVGSSIEENGG